MKRNTSDVEIRQEYKHTRRFYEKPQFVEVQLMADQTLGNSCSYQAGNNVACDTFPMSS